MAQISPYGDPNANGQLNKSLCFQRYKSKVFLRAYPNPVARYTPAAEAQRKELIDAVNAYKILTGATKNFFRQRASQKQQVGRGLFLSAHMKKYLPSILTPIPAKSIEDIVIFTPAGLYSDEIKISITNEPYITIPDLEAGCVAWWKLENLLAEIGVNWTELGTVEWRDCKFLKGVWNDINVNYLRLIENFFNPNKFFYHCWIKLDYDVVNGATQGIDGCGLFSWYGWEFANRIYINFNAVPTSGLTTLIQLPGGFVVYYCINPAVTFNSGTVNRFSFVYNRLGIDGGPDIYRIYFERDLVFSSVLVPLDQVIRNTYLYQNTDINSSGAAIHPLHGVSDNPKIYDVTTQAFIDAVHANDYREGFPPGLKEYGNIYDSEQIYTKVDEVLEPELQKIIISTPSGHPCHIPFRYLMRVEWKDFEDTIFNSVIRLPEIILGAAESLTLYLSKDWSVYYDPNFHRLACTNQL